MTDPSPAALTHLLELLDLTEVDPASAAASPHSQQLTVWRGGCDDSIEHLFGGHVLAQGVVACGRTVAHLDGGERRIHSLHAYFMRAGDVHTDIDYVVEHMRDGASFSTRRVHAMQHGRPILSMSASFQTASDGPDHEVPAPDVPGPEGISSLHDLYGPVDHPVARALVATWAFEQRHVEGDVNLASPEHREPHQHVWFKTVGPVPEDPLVGDALLAYASDYSLLQPAQRAHGISLLDPRARIASLDHAMWFHRPARVDRWMLYAEESPSTQGGRALGLGRVYQDGRLVASVAQEGMMRLKADA